MLYGVFFFVLMVLGTIAAVVIPISLALAGFRYWKGKDAFSALVAPMKAFAALGLVLGVLLIPLGLAIGTGASYVLTAAGCVLVVSCTWGYTAVRRRSRVARAAEPAPKPSIKSAPGVI